MFVELFWDQSRDISENFVGFLMQLALINWWSLHKLGLVNCFVEFWRFKNFLLFQRSKMIKNWVFERWSCQKHDWCDLGQPPVSDLTHEVYLEFLILWAEIKWNQMYQQKIFSSSYLNLQLQILIRRWLDFFFRKLLSSTPKLQKLQNCKFSNFFSVFKCSQLTAQLINS